jgi:hypothetical protein
MATVKRALGEAIGRVDVSLGPEGLGVGIANAAIAFAVIMGGCLLIVIIRWAWFKFLLWRSKCSMEWVKTGQRDGTRDIFVKRDDKARDGMAMAQVASELVFILLFAASLWFGYFAAGFNFLNSPYLPLILSLVGTYMFSSALQNLGNKIWTNAENVFPTGAYVRLPCMGAESHGFIVIHNAFHILLKRRDKTSGGLVEIKLTYSDFFNQMVIRDWNTENDPAEWQLLETNDVIVSQMVDAGKAKKEELFADRCGRRNTEDHQKRTSLVKRNMANFDKLV